MLIKLGVDKGLKVPHTALGILARSTQGQIKDGAKKFMRAPSLKKNSDRKTTATNRKHSNDLEACRKKCCYFFVPSLVFDTLGGGGGGGVIKIRHNLINFGSTIMVIPHTKKVNVSFRLHFELTESFGLIICYVY